MEVPTGVKNTLLALTVFVVAGIEKLAAQITPAEKFKADSVAFAQKTQKASEDYFQRIEKENLAREERNKAIAKANRTVAPGKFCGSNPHGAVCVEERTLAERMAVLQEEAKRAGVSPALIGLTGGRAMAPQVPASKQITAIKER